MVVYWFDNPYEHRNHWLKLGLMRLHWQGRLELHLHPLHEAVKNGFSPKAVERAYRHIAYLVLEKDNRKINVLVDSEDSFIQLCPLIKEVDIYFKAGFNTNFHRHQRFIDPLPWQSEEDIRWYREESERIWEMYGKEFNKIRKFIPISPEMRLIPQQKGYLRQKVSNLKYKLHKKLGNSLAWEEVYQRFEQRYTYLKALRDQSLNYDVVLLDSLWGWPEHRYRLHQKLKGLSGEYQIYSRLAWRQNNVKYGQIGDLSEKKFPLETKLLEGNYEEMIASSRLGVFATGFHWGWRSIMAMAFMVGLPVYMDRLLLEPYFDMGEFIWYENKDEWASLEDTLQRIDDKKWQDIKKHNQQVYDSYMDPVKVGEYFISTALNG